MTESGPVAVVTGAGTGLGATFAHGLRDAGFRVAFVGRTAETLEQASGGRGLVLPADATDPAQVEGVFDTVVSTWGRVDVLVNNAGTFGPTGEPDEIDVAAWQAVVDVNLTGVFLCARAAFGVMKTQDPHGGRIINNGSISAHTPRPGSVAYTATKHGVTGLTKALLLDGRSHEIACSQIDIGNAATEMTAGIATGARQADGSMSPEPTFDPVHAADALVRLAQLPLDVNVPFLTIMANGMPYAGRG